MKVFSRLKSTYLTSSYRHVLMKFKHLSKDLKSKVAKWSKVNIYWSKMILLPVLVFLGQNSWVYWISPETNLRKGWKWHFIQNYLLIPKMSLKRILMAFPDENNLVFEISSLKAGTFYNTKNFKWLKTLIFDEQFSLFLWKHFSRNNLQEDS